MTVYAMVVARDDHDLAVFTLVLQRAGLAVTTAPTVDRVLSTWSDRPADILLVALPPAGCEQALREIRRVTAVPLVVAIDGLTEGLHIDLLQAGADLVLPASFSARLLIAQVQVLLRRAGGVAFASLPTLKVDQVTLDPATRTIVVEDRAPCRLTHLEFRLLYTLMINRGQVLPTERIVELVWGYTGQGDRELVRGLISRLRAKIEPNPRHPQYIQTVPGVGYAFAEVPGLRAFQD